MATEAMPKVSVIIPAYNQAAYIGMALESVLDQSYSNWELLVVNDASPDQTDAVVAQYADPRIRLIHHESNRGLPAARNSGLRAATGELLFLLDADDCFHVDKLAAHVAFLRAHPDVGVSYNARYEMNEAGETVTLWRPPTTVTFADLVCRFPFAPSDLVVRREWALRVQLFDERYVNMSEDLDFHGRLALAGCRFAGIDRALNYRRRYPNRIMANAPARLQAAEQALTALFDHPACSPPLASWRDQALANANLAWAYECMIAGLTHAGQQALRKAITLHSALVAQRAAPLLTFFIERSIQDGGDHAAALQQVMAQLPAELHWLSAETTWAIGQADLQAGARAYLWGRVAQGTVVWQRAANQGVRVEPTLLPLLVDQVLSISREGGRPAAEAALARLKQGLPLVASPATIRQLEGCYWLNEALTQDKTGAYDQAWYCVLQAFYKDPGHLRNRGAWATLVRSSLFYLSPWPKRGRMWAD